VPPSFHVRRENSPLPAAPSLESWAAGAEPPSRPTHGGPSASDFDETRRVHGHANGQDAKCQPVKSTSLAVKSRVAVSPVLAHFSSERSILPYGHSQSLAAEDSSEPDGLDEDDGIKRKDSGSILPKTYRISTHGAGSTSGSPSHAAQASLWPKGKEGKRDSRFKNLSVNTSAQPSQVKFWGGLSKKKSKQDKDTDAPPTFISPRSGSEDEYQSDGLNHQLSDDNLVLQTSSDGQVMKVKTPSDGMAMRITPSMLSPEDNVDLAFDNTEEPPPTPPYTSALTPPVRETSLESVKSPPTRPRTSSSPPTRPSRPSISMQSNFSIPSAVIMSARKNLYNRSSSRKLDQMVDVRQTMREFTSNYDSGEDDSSRSSNYTIRCSDCLSFFRCYSTMETKALNFNQLCRDRYGSNVFWEDLKFTEQVDLIRDGLMQKTFLIDPDTAYIRCFDILLMICLLFTAIVTPYEIAFLTFGYNWLYALNKVVDFIFIKDMIIQFFTKVR